jgi:lipase chaperone LimK
MRKFKLKIIIGLALTAMLLAAAIVEWGNIIRTPFSLGSDGLLIKNTPPINSSGAINNSIRRGLIKPVVKHVSIPVAEYEKASSYGKLPKHLHDVAIDKLSYDENENFVLSSDLKYLIEHFLTVTKIEGLEQAIARIEEYINMTLPPNAASQAAAIVEDYLEYKSSLAEINITYTENPVGIERIEQLKLALDERKKIRGENFSNEVATVFFGNEEAYEEHSLRRAEIVNASYLSGEQKNLLFALEEDKLPPRIRQRVRYNRGQNNLEKEISLLRESGGSNEDVHDLRKSFYGKKVAGRIQYLESQPPQWQARVNEYYNEKNAIEHLSGFDSSEKAQLIKDVKDRLFSEKEKIKLSVQSVRSQ